MKTINAQHLTHITIESSKRGVYSVAFSSDSSTLATDKDNTIELWDLITGQVRKTLWVDIGDNFTADINSIAFSPDGGLLAGGVNERETVCLWNVNTGEQLKIMRGDVANALHWVNTVAFSIDGKMLASGSEDGNLCLWDIATGTQLTTFTDAVAHIFSVVFNSQLPKPKDLGLLRDR